MVISIYKKTRVLGDYLIVAVYTDEFNVIKGKRCYFPYDERKNTLDNIKKHVLYN